VEAYEAECRKHGFKLRNCQCLGLRASRRAHDQTLAGLAILFIRPLDNLIPGQRPI
jgi:hypothetical protein